MAGYDRPSVIITMPPRKRDDHATLPRGEAEKGIQREGPSNTVQNNEQAGGHEGQPDNSQRQGDGAQAQSGHEEVEAPPTPTKAYGEQWRGIVAGSIYRVFTIPAGGMYPERISVELLISRGQDQEQWIPVWNMQ